MTSKKNNWPKIANLSLRRFRLLKIRIENSDKIIHLLTQEAKSRHADPGVLAVLGVCYLEGLGVQQDTARALKYLLSAQEKAQHKEYIACMGMGELAKLIAECYQKQKNDTQAFKYFSEALAQGYFEAGFELAECCLHGKGTSVDMAKAADYYLKLAQSNKPDLSKKAFDCLRELAQQEVFDPDVQNSLALCYRFGYAVDIDLVKTNALLENIAQTYWNRINEGSFLQENLLRAYEQINRCFHTICTLDIQVLERRRHALQSEQTNERQLEEISTVLRCINRVINTNTKQSDEEVSMELLQINSVPEVKHLMAFIDARANARILCQSIKAELVNVIEKINAGKWQISFLGLWWEGTPANIGKIKSLLKDQEWLKQQSSTLDIYRQMIKLLTKIQPFSRRHPDADVFYKESLTSLKAVTTPQIILSAASTKTSVPEKKKEKEVVLLDLSDEIDSSAPLTAVTCLPEQIVMQSSYQSIYPVLAAASFQVAELPPPYPVENIVASAPPSDWLHEYQVQEQLNNCMVINDEPSVVEQGLFAQKIVIPVAKPVENRKDKTMVLA